MSDIPAFNAKTIEEFAERKHAGQLEKTRASPEFADTFSGVIPEHSPSRAVFGPVSDLSEWRTSSGATKAKSPVALRKATVVP